MPNEREMKIKDFYGACLLHAMKYPLIRMERGEGDFLMFVFDDPEFKAETVLDEYWEGRVQIDAKTLVDSIRDLKTRIHQRL